MTVEDINHLIDLNPSHFDYKEWLALKYAQEWAFLRGEEPSGDYVEEYKNRYSEKDRAYILKIMRAIQYSNFMMNLLTRKPWKSDLENSCSINNK